MSWRRSASSPQDRFHSKPLCQIGFSVRRQGGMTVPSRAQALHCTPHALRASRRITRLWSQSRLPQPPLTCVARSTTARYWPRLAKKRGPRTSRDSVPDTVLKIVPPDRRPKSDAEVRMWRQAHRRPCNSHGSPPHPGQGGVPARLRDLGDAVDETPGKPVIRQRSRAHLRVVRRRSRPPGVLPARACGRPRCRAAGR